MASVFRLERYKLHAKLARPRAPRRNPGPWCGMVESGSTRAVIVPRIVERACDKPARLRQAFPEKSEFLLGPSGSMDTGESLRAGVALAHEGYATIIFRLRVLSENCGLHSEEVGQNISIAREAISEGFKEIIWIEEFRQ